MPCMSQPVTAAAAWCWQGSVSLLPASQRTPCFLLVLPSGFSTIFFSSGEPPDPPPSIHVLGWILFLLVPRVGLWLRPDQSEHSFPRLGNGFKNGQVAQPEATRYNGRAPLVAQWLRIRLPMQGFRVPALVQEDPTCRGATKPMRHNYWACALEPANHNYWAHVPRAHAPQQEKPPQWEARAPQQRVAPARRN